MSFLLDLVYLLLALLASPFLLFKVLTSERWRAGIRERLGGVPERKGGRKCVWVHAVSVGEVNAVRGLARLIENDCPEWDARVSTMTNTGQRVAREAFGAERCFYFPLDLSWAVRRAFRRVRPDAVVLVELELWPNFLRVARRMGVPVVVVNGRMREERVARYRRGRFLFAPAFDPRGPNLFCVQNETYRDRFERAGIPAGRIRVTGNMKYDSLSAEVVPAKVAELRATFGLRAEERLWVAACTWPGEEEICLRAHKRLLRKDPALRLVIAPRHIERAGEVARAVAAAGFPAARRTAAAGHAPPDAILILDTVGELGYVYMTALFAFVGKSLTARGGHNMLEPAALGVPSVYGPLTDNFEEEARLLIEAEASVRVADEAGLLAALEALLTDENARRAMSARGKAAVEQRRGAGRRNLALLREVLSERPSR